MRSNLKNEDKLWYDYNSLKTNQSFNNLIELYYYLVEKYKKIYIKRCNISEFMHIDVHDVCLDCLYSSIENFDIGYDNTFETYYNKRLKGYILNIIEQQKKKPILLDDDSKLDIEDTSLNNDFNVSDIGFSIDMINLLEKYLSEDDIEIIKLRYINDYTFQKIADILELSKDNIKSKHDRILHKIKRKIESR